jgi:hypothetical protein
MHLVGVSFSGFSSNEVNLAQKSNRLGKGLAARLHEERTINQQLLGVFGLEF